MYLQKKQIAMDIPKVVHDLVLETKDLRIAMAEQSPAKLKQWVLANAHEDESGNWVLNRSHCSIEEALSIVNSKGKGAYHFWLQGPQFLDGHHDRQPENQYKIMMLLQDAFRLDFSKQKFSVVDFGVPKRISFSDLMLRLFMLTKSPFTGMMLVRSRENVFQQVLKKNIPVALQIRYAPILNSEELDEMDGNTVCMIVNPNQTGAWFSTKKDVLQTFLNNNLEDPFTRTVPPFSYLDLKVLGYKADALEFPESRQGIDPAIIHTCSYPDYDFKLLLISIGIVRADDRLLLTLRAGLAEFEESLKRTKNPPLEASVKNIRKSIVEEETRFLIEQTQLDLNRKAYKHIPISIMMDTRCERGPKGEVIEHLTYYDFGNKDTDTVFKVAQTLTLPRVLFKMNFNLKNKSPSAWELIRDPEDFIRFQ
ncbi:MAG: hypothetical protein EXS67_03990 [Candidatus Margulisbacteria bacterium]|nr:hypothetical protein [Candidatus Margulisiibacteriota bacterium]